MSIAVQPNLLASAVAAGVTRFIPSQYGTDLEAARRSTPLAPFWNPKLDFAERLRASGLDYLIMQTGIVSEYLLKPFLGIDLAASTITAPAPAAFDAIFATTPCVDIGRVTAELIARDDLHRATVKVSSAVLTMDQLTVMLQELSGKQLQRRVRSEQDMQAAIEANSMDFPARFGSYLGQQRTTWAMANTWNEQHHFPMTPVSDLFRKHVG